MLKRYLDFSKQLLFCEFSKYHEFLTICQVTGSPNCIETTLEIVAFLRYFSLPRFINNIYKIMLLQSAFENAKAFWAVKMQQVCQQEVQKVNCCAYYVKERSVVSKKAYLNFRFVVILEIHRKNKSFSHDHFSNK